MNKNNYLPIGSVIKIKNEEQLLMITGYKVISEEKTYDYSACFFPNGILSLNEVLVFNQDKIDIILFEGYKNDDYNKVNEILNKWRN